MSFDYQGFSDWCHNEIKKTMTKEDVIKLMESSKTEKEWNENCDLVKACFDGGYPSWWYVTIIMAGILSKVKETWSK